MQVLGAVRVGRYQGYVILNPRKEIDFFVSVHDTISWPPFDTIDWPFCAIFVRFESLTPVRCSKVKEGTIGYL